MITFAFLWVSKDDISMRMTDVTNLLAICTGGGSFEITTSDMLFLSDDLRALGYVSEPAIIQMSSRFVEMFPEEHRAEAFGLYKQCLVEVAQSINLEEAFQFR